MEEATPRQALGNARLADLLSPHPTSSTSPADVIGEAESLASLGHDVLDSLEKHYAKRSPTGPLDRHGTTTTDLELPKRTDYGAWAKRLGKVAKHLGALDTAMRMLNILLGDYEGERWIDDLAIEAAVLSVESAASTAAAGACTTAATPPAASTGHPVIAVGAPVAAGLACGAVASHIAGEVARPIATPLFRHLFDDVPASTPTR